MPTPKEQKALAEMKDVEAQLAALLASFEDLKKRARASKNGSLASRDKKKLDDIRKQLGLS